MKYFKTFAITAMIAVLPFATLAAQKKFTDANLKAEYALEIGVANKEIAKYRAEILVWQNKLDARKVACAKNRNLSKEDCQFQETAEGGEISKLQQTISALEQKKTVLGLAYNLILNSFK